MTDAFADLVMPIFQNVIDLQDRLDQLAQVEHPPQVPGGLVVVRRGRCHGQGPDLAAVDEGPGEVPEMATEWMRVEVILQLREVVVRLRNVLQLLGEQAL